MIIRNAATRLVALILFVFINFSLAAQVSVTIYKKEEKKSDSITSERTYEAGYLVFEYEIGPNEDSGNINLFLIDAASNDTLQKTALTCIYEPEYMEGKGTLYVVHEINASSDDSFAALRLENRDEVCIMFDDSYVKFQGDVRYEEEQL